MNRSRDMEGNNKKRGYGAPGEAYSTSHKERYTTNDQQLEHDAESKYQHSRTTLMERHHTKEGRRNGK